MKEVIIGVVLSTVLALIFVLIEKHYKKKFQKFAQQTNATITEMWTKWVQIETLYGTCQVNYAKDKSKSGRSENWAFDFIGIDELCERLSTYEGEFTVNIYPKNTIEWINGIKQLNNERIYANTGQGQN